MKSLALLLLLCGVLPAPAAEKRPNILLILADDLGWSDLGCYGGEIRTPVLDGLAAGGLRYTQFYNSARCCPSRASLLTGLYPQQAGVGSMTADEKLPGYRGSLQPDCVTFAEVLKTAGYHTSMVGKWHVGDQVPPTTRGFEDFYGFIRGYAVGSWEPRMMIRLPAGRPQRRYGAGQYFATDAITDHALDFIAEARQAGGPWLSYVAYQAAHFPVQSRPEDMAGYPELYARGWDAVRAQRLERQQALGLVPAGTTLPPRSPIPQPKVAERLGSLTPDGANPAWDSLPAERRADLAQRMAVYAGMVTGMDRNIGRLLEDLRAHGELEHTLILFLSDNGACAEWEPFGFDFAPTAQPKAGTGIGGGTPGFGNTLHRGAELARMGGPGQLFSYGSDWANASNTPWRYYKHNNFEGGIRTPLIMHWPERIPAHGALRAQVGHLIDVLPTLAEVGGAAYPAEFGGQKIQPAEGRSLVTTWDDAPLPSRDLAWEHEGNRALRREDWKLVSLPGRPWELYDLAHDPTELADLAGQEPDRVREMAHRWETWAARARVLRHAAR